MRKMCLTLSVLILILCNVRIIVADRNVQLGNSKGKSFSNDEFSHLNDTYSNLNEKILQLQRRVDTMEELTRVDDQCNCNQSEFKRSTSNELKDFLKILSGFENEMRFLENEQEEIGRILDGRNNSVTHRAPELTCEDGWIRSPEGICYYVTPPSEQTNWATAIERCKSKGANLVEFKTDEQAEFMLQNMPNMSMTYYIYTGRKMNEQDVWVFLTDGEPIDTSLRTWARGEPDGNEPTTACGCIKTSSADFRMSDCVCAGFSFQFICQKEPMPVGVTPTPTPRTRDCDDGWTSSLEKCYYYSEDKTNWMHAKDYCETMGAKLVEMKTDEEALYVMENLPSRIGSNDLVYTGRKVNDVGRWVFGSSGEEVDSAKRSWAMFEPNGEGVQNCGCTKSSGFFRMKDCHCIGFSLHYICEIIR